MGYMGFKALQSKIEAQGKSAASAGAIAASVGRAKYGPKKFNQAAATHHSLRKAAAAKAVKK